MSEVMRKEIDNEIYCVEQVYDELLITVRRKDGEPFEGDESPYEIRAVVYPDRNISMSLVSFVGGEEIAEVFRDQKYLKNIHAILDGIATTKYLIHDLSASEVADTWDRTIEIVYEWYKRDDDLPDVDWPVDIWNIDEGDLDALNEAIREYEHAIARAIGKRSANEAGFSLSVDKQIEWRDPQ
ncbi:MAG: hypothetical protein N3G75_06750 [Methanothrix sp.]|nr:hypothetical protein [Methanothrix sp.]MCX8207515.1 hypothetical protein [Methanothrix sp.]